MATTHKISEIKGLTEEARAKMVEANITTIEHLIHETNTGPKRSAFAKKIGLEPKDLTELINRADLMRLKGVGTEMANLLEECGVDSCKELQHRKAENLQEKLKSVNDEKKITHHAPNTAQVTEWIKEAAEFSKVDATA